MTRFRLRTAFECPAAWAGRGTFNAPSRQERCGELTSRWRASCYTLRRSITTFDKREEGFEQKFAHEEAMRFKATARRNKPLGLRRGTGSHEPSGRSKLQSRSCASSDLIMTAPETPKPGGVANRPISRSPDNPAHPRQRARGAGNGPAANTPAGAAEGRTHLDCAITCHASSAGDVIFARCWSVNPSHLPFVLLPKRCN
jgi:hypothetical protein